MKRMSESLFVRWLVVVLGVVVGRSDASAEPKAAACDLLNAPPEAIEWWQDARFGMFVFWGPATLTGQEIGWSRGAPARGRRAEFRGGEGAIPAEVYDSLSKKWKPDDQIKSLKECIDLLVTCAGRGGNPVLSRSTRRSYHTR